MELAVPSRRVSPADRSWTTMCSQRSSRWTVSSTSREPVVCGQRRELCSGGVQRVVSLVLSRPGQRRRQRVDATLRRPRSTGAQGGAGRASP